MFINKSKEDRARRVVKNPNEFKDAECVERIALAKGLAEKLTGEDLVLFVYKMIGGAVAGEETKVAPTPEYEAQVEGTEVEEVGKKRVRKSA